MRLDPRSGSFRKGVFSFDSGADVRMDFEGSGFGLEDLDFVAGECRFCDSNPISFFAI